MQSTPAQSTSKNLNSKKDKNKGTMNGRNLVNIYLADETKLYQDWFQNMNANDDQDVIEFAEFPSLESLKKRFNDWLESQKLALKQKICVEWDYTHKKKIFENKEDLIIAVSMDCLVVGFGVPTTNTLTIAAILVMNGYLKNLCV